MKSMRQILKTEVLIFLSKANLNNKILFSKITDHLDPENRKMLVGDMFWNENSTFHSDP